MHVLILIIFDLVYYPLVHRIGGLPAIIRKEGRAANVSNSRYDSAKPTMDSPRRIYRHELLSQYLEDCQSGRYSPPSPGRE